MSSARGVRTIVLVGDTLALGGTEGQFVEVATRLDPARWDVRVTCLRAEGPLRERLLAKGITPWSCGPRSLRSPGLALAVARLARYLRRERVRLIHAFDVYSNVLGVMAGRLARVPAVVASQRDLGDLRPPLDRRVQRAMLRMAGHVLVNSEAVAERVAAGWPRPRAISVVVNGVDAARFAPARRPDRPDEGPVIGTLANLRPEKGIEDFIRAAALVNERQPGTRFVVWGDGPLRGALEALIARLGLEGVVSLAGATTRPEAALATLDVFVLASLSEACSNVLLEAMAAGLGIVATRVGGNPYLVEDGASGLLAPPAAPAALADAIGRLLADGALRVTLGRRARDRVLTEFGFDRMVARIDGLYADLLRRVVA